MSVETISKILSPTNATYVNGVSAERRFSPAVLKNLYQGLVEKDGRGITDKFVSEDDAQSSAQVFVNRILPIKMTPREQGANKNGASYSANQHYVQTETVGIEILTVLDDPILIARARQDMIKVDLLAEETEIYSNRLKTILNGATFGCKVLGVGLAKAEGNAVNEKKITSTDITNKVVLDRFVEANSLLDEGDDEHGVDIFPEDSRICVVKTSYRATLKTGGVLVLGGANYGYEIAKGDAIAVGETARRSEDGFIGTIDGVPCHIISNESLAHASQFCGFPAGEFKASALIGYISSAWANARGVSTAKQTKIVDEVNGQGIRLLPYTKFGVASWYPKGNVLLKSEDYDPFGDLKTAFASVSGITYKLKGAGSRLFPVFPSDVWATEPTATNDKFKLSGITCPDDWNTDHEKGALWVEGTTACATVGEFFKLYNDTTITEKGTANIGTDTTAVSGFTANKYISVLVIADDGSCGLISKKVGA